MGNVKYGGRVNAIYSFASAFNISGQTAREWVYEKGCPHPADNQVAACLWASEFLPRRFSRSGSGCGPQRTNRGERIRALAARFAVTNSTIYQWEKKGAPIFDDSIVAWVDGFKGKPKLRKPRGKNRKQRVKSEHSRAVRSCRHRIYKLLKLGRIEATETTRELLGCSAAALRDWLQSQFQQGMTWQNYGKWHVDHKMPCAAFDLNIPGQRRRCFNYTNLQPLWATENMRKGARVAQ